ncbi:MAG TPA: efflux RND transporter permease subunit [Rhodocyclaceae bacterium]|nr:efflux RND transporter permease subunit [Rhodocyclaceae bacterium]
MFAKIIRHGILVAVVSLIVLILGVVAAERIPVQMIPDLEVRTISVVTRWAGATPQDIEKDIVIEQERYLRNLPNLQRMTATAGSGFAEIELEFPFGVDVTQALLAVNNALSQVPGYPRNVDQPRIVASSFSANAFMHFSIGPREGDARRVEVRLMQDFVEDRVRPRMESIAGVSEVRVFGGLERQLQVLVDAEALAQRGLGLTDVRDAIRARNQDISGGEVTAGKRRYLLRTVGRFQEPAELAALVLRRDGDSVLRLGEVAEVRQGNARPRYVSRFNGDPRLALSVRRQPGSNVIEIKRAMLAEVDAINADILHPAGMHMALNSDDVRYVEASIANVWTNLAIGAVFATLVMFAFLRSVRATLVGVIGIPLCAVVAFIALMVTGRTINVISLAGVAFAIGMSIDNSIVVLENIERYRRLGLDRIEAALQGVREVWPAVLASTMTTVLVFLPILFIVEEAGQLYSDVAIAISGAILASMLVAITLIPTLCARVDFGRREGDAGRFPRLNRVLRALPASPLRRGAVMVGTVGAAVLIIALLTPPAEYLPEGEEPKTFAAMNPPPGYNLETMGEIAREVEAYFMPHVDADAGAFERGETPVPPIRYINLSYDPTRLRIISETVDPAHIEALMDAITAYYERFPGMRAFAAKGSIISSNDAGTRSISLDVSGPDLVGIFEAARAIDRRARELFDNPRIRSQPSSLSLAQPLVQIRPDWDRAAELGLSADAIGFSVAALTEGAYVDDFFLGDDKIDIYLYGANAAEPQLEQVPGLLLRTPGGATLPLSAVARIEELADTILVRRVDGRRTVTLDIIPPEEVALETGVARVKSELIGAMRASGELGRDIAVDISGASDQLERTRAALSGNFTIALAIVYLLLVAIFAHWGYPFIIMTAIPLGVAGGIVGLALMNAVGALLPLAGLPPLTQPFDMITMLGFLILMGTVVNNPILIVDQARRNLEHGHMSLVEAVGGAIEARLRPIAMTTLTTLCGIAPLVLIPGEGTELYRGVGAIVLFGLLGAAIVTLTFLPALLVFVFGLARRLGLGDSQPAASST